MKHTHNTIVGLALVTATLSSVLGFTACSAPANATPVCIGIAVGNRAQSAPVTRIEVQDIIPTDLPVGSKITVVEVSGAPMGESVDKGIFTVADMGDSTDQADEQAAVRGQVLTAIADASATQPEADTLGAIEGAAANLGASVGCTIYVYDSGISTAGLLQFQAGPLLSSDAATVAGMIPQATTLKNMSVNFMTLGAVAGDQPAPDATTTARLAAIWQAVIQRRGGTMTQSSPSSLGSTALKDGLPDVTVVDIPSWTPDWTHLEPVCTGTSTTWTLPGDALFAPDSSTLTDYAKGLFDGAATELLNNPDAQAVIVAHSASISDTPHVTQTSIDRANAVVNYLESKGVPASRLQPSGVGDTQPSCEDWDPTTGTQIEPCAQQERRVDLIIPNENLCNS